MSEQEILAAKVFGDFKKLIVGKCIRTYEYELSNIKLQLEKRTDIPQEYKNLFGGLINVFEQNSKDEIKRLEV